MRPFAVLAVLTSLAAQAWAVTINTPTSVVQCQPVLLSWSDGTAPYFLSILPGGQASATALKTFDSTEATSLTWTVDIAAGTSITLQIRDSTGTIAYSDVVSIQSSSDSSCVSTSTAESASAGATSAGDVTVTGAATATGVASATSGTATGTSTKAASGSSTGTASGAASSSSSSSGAMLGSSINAAGIAGVLGLVGAALL